MTSEETLMTTTQAAELLGVSTKTVIRTAKRKGIKLGRLKREYRMTRAQALSLVDVDVAPKPDDKPLGDASESPPSSR